MAIPESSFTSEFFKISPGGGEHSGLPVGDTPSKMCPPLLVSERQVESGHQPDTAKRA